MLENDIALVTGASRGIGHAMALALAKAGPTAEPALSGAVRSVNVDSAMRRKALTAVLSLGAAEARNAVPAIVEGLKTKKMLGNGQDQRPQPGAPDQGAERELP